MPPKKRKFDEAGSSQRSPRKRVNAADSSQQSLDSFLLSGRSAQNKAIVKEERSGAPREIIIIDDNEEEATYSHKGLATENVDIAIDSTVRRDLTLIRCRSVWKLIFRFSDNIQSVGQSLSS